MRMENYKNRFFDSILRDALDAKGAVLIEGAKWCGKTTTAEQIAKSVIYPKNGSWGRCFFTQSRREAENAEGNANLKRYRSCQN